MFEITLEKVVLIAIFLLVAFPVHEFAHAAAAYLLGDSTAKLFGRLTLNPVAHFDPAGGLMLVVSALVSPFLFGWAKPTPVNTANLRDRRNGEVIVALAGPFSNLVMALIGAFAIRLLVALGVDIPNELATILLLFVYFNVALLVFNLIPIPPLDGSTLLFRILSPRQAWQLRPLLTQYGFIVLILILLVGSPVIGRLMFDVTEFLVGG